MSATAVAEDHHRDRALLAEDVGEAATERWAAVSPTRIVDSWMATIPEMLVLVSAAQLAAARQATPYVADVLAAQGLAASPTTAVPEQVSGVASDGRPLAGLLRSPMAAALTVLPTAGSQRAMAVGLAVLDMIVRTQVADAGRAADWVSAMGSRDVTGYVRMTVGKTCARCAILAGRWYRWSRGFKRHPRCDCVMVPSSESISDDIRLDPRRLISSGRVTGLSVASRDAITAGADPAQVVNADRGMYVADGRRFTTESTTKRGSGPRIRLMPGQIIAEAAGDRDETVRLLRFHGYIR
jgi:hypothetical protein